MACYWRARVRAANKPVPVAGAADGSAARGTGLAAAHRPARHRRRRLVLLRVTPAALLAALNNGVSQWTGDSTAAGRFPQVSGMRFAFNPTFNASQRLVDAALAGGTKLSALTTDLIVITNNFVAAGGDGWAAQRGSAELGGLPGTGRGRRLCRPCRCPRRLPRTSTTARARAAQVHVAGALPQAAGHQRG